MANILMPAIVVDDGKIPGGTINAGTSAVTAVPSGYHNVQNDLILPAVTQTSLSASNIVSGAEVTIKTGDNILFSVIGSAASGGNDVIVEIPEVERAMKSSGTSDYKRFYNADYGTSEYGAFYIEIAPSEFEGVIPRCVYAMPIYKSGLRDDIRWWKGGACLQAYNEVFTGGQFTHSQIAASWIDTSHETNDWMKMNRTDGIIIPIAAFPYSKVDAYIDWFSYYYRAFIIGEAE